MYDIVDLGTKKGGSLDRACRRSQELFGFQATPNNCLGIDKNEGYMARVRGRGFKFCHRNVLLMKDFPQARVYVAFDFLEHLPNVEMSISILTRMLLAAEEGVFLQLPSFEQDEEGEGQLRRHGLRFTWTEWRGHTSHFLCEHVEATVKETYSHFGLVHNRKKKIRTSRSEYVVPIRAPDEATVYLREYGEKPFVEFDPPVVGCHEIVIYRKSNGQENQ